jgi:DNA invertase Pin-like site-specific DNA recombinase
MLTHSEKITARHLERRAYVYIRQSSPKQVREHRTSQENQYALGEHAVHLGWGQHRIAIIDDDLGQSGQDGRRKGFQTLVSAVSLGQVGIILSYEASRLARNNADWYRLLDLAAMMDTLIADTDGVYDPRDYNDRLLLGLRGMLSEAELHLLQLRLTAGRQRQIEHGTYRQHLPTGLVRLEDGRVVKDPDHRIQHTIALIFARFAQLGTCQKVLRSLHDDGILLPRRQVAGPRAGELLWKPPAVAALYGILHNPAYAGAFAYGRRGPSAVGQISLTPRRLRGAPAAWTALHQDVYPAYITWEHYMANQEQLADNASSFARRARGAPRDGEALLAGLAVCGYCGHHLRVAYKRQHRYVCNALNETHRAPMCLSVDGASVDAVVVAAFFAALAPAELDLLEELVTAQERERQQLQVQHADRVTQAEYEARLAQRRYQAVDPENRLVAAELEHRWEVALRVLAEAREAAARAAHLPPAPALDPALRSQLRDLGPQLPALWTSGRLSPAQQKELLRSLIRRVILTRPTPDTIAVKVVWVSGASSLLTAHPPLHRGKDLPDYARLVAQIQALSAEGHPDPAIAARLSTEGYRSARSHAVPATLVEKVRRQSGQVSLLERFRTEAKIDGRWTVGGLARELGVSSDWLRRRIARGKVPAIHHPTTGRYLIPDDPATFAALKLAARACCAS